jgi:hypothetical protein
MVLKLFEPFELNSKSFNRLTLCYEDPRVSRPRRPILWPEPHMSAPLQFPCLSVTRAARQPPPPAGRGWGRKAPPPPIFLPCIAVPHTGPHTDPRCHAGRYRRPPFFSLACFLLATADTAPHCTPPHPRSNLVDRSIVDAIGNEVIAATIVASW